MTEPRFISTLSWAARHISLDDGKFDPDQRPQLKEIAETVDRRCGCTFILRFPPQAFKSLYMQLRLMRSVAVTPTRALWYCKKGKDVEAFSQEKLKSLIESTGPVRAKLAYESDSRGTKTLFRFMDGPLSLLGADIRNDRNQRSGQDLYLDETWQYEPGHIAEIRARSDDFEETRRIIMAETAPDEGHESDVLFERSSKRHWHCVCTLCNERIELDFGEIDPQTGTTISQHGFKWDEIRGSDGLWNSAAAAKTARFVCPACNGTIPWAPNVTKKLSDPTRGACYIARNGNPDPLIEAWTANAFVFRNWQALIVEWLTAWNAKIIGSTELLEEFTKKKLVKAWSLEKYVKQDAQLTTLPYKLREEWADEATFPNSKKKMRFVWVDVQQRWYWGLCRKWSADGRSRLHDFRKLGTDYEIKKFAEECGVEPSMVVLDQAYDPKQKGQRWGRTTKICAEYGFMAANAIGTELFTHKGGFKRMYSEPFPVDAWQGEKEMGRRPPVWCFTYSSNGAKHMLHTLRQQKHPATGEWMHSIPEDATEEYKEQAWAERLEKKKNPNGGYYYEWKRTDRDNHAFDLEAGQCVMATMFELTGATSVRTEEPPSAATVDGSTSKEDGV